MSAAPRRSIFTGLPAAVLMGYPAMFVAEAMRAHLRDGGTANMHEDYQHQVLAALEDVERAASAYRRWATETPEQNVASARGNSVAEIAEVERPSSHEFISTNDAADHLGVTERRIRQLCGGSQGLGRSYRGHDGRWRVERAALLVLAESRRAA